MRLMGLDLGDKKIGVAVSDELGFTAQGVGVIRADRSGEKALVDIVEQARHYNVEGFVVGLPKNMNGTLGPRAQKVLEFAGRLEAASNLPVYQWDERLSTVAAERTLLEADVSRRKRKTVIDKMAAMFILQGYLDAQGSRGKV